MLRHYVAKCYYCNNDCNFNSDNFDYFASKTQCGIPTVTRHVKLSRMTIDEPRHTGDFQPSKSVVC